MDPLARRIGVLIMDELDINDLIGPSGGIGGIRKMCTDHKRCGLGLACEHGQTRNESCELVSLWGGQKGTCPNFTPRKELHSENDIFRPKGRKKHNQLSRSNILGADGKPLKAPDPMTRRHIRDGRNIKGDD